MSFLVVAVRAIVFGFHKQVFVLHPEVGLPWNREILVHILKFLLSDKKLSLGFKFNKITSSIWAL